MRCLLLLTRARRLLVGTARDFWSAADPDARASEKITVKATDAEVRTKFQVKKGEWLELAITGKSARLGCWEYTGPQGHVPFGKVTKLGYLGALVCRIGDGQPFTLPDSYPFQAADSGEVRFWPNREGRTQLKADGQLTVIIRTGDHLKDKKARARAHRKAAYVELLADPQVRKTLALLNEARKACGLPEVKLSLELSSRCEKHARSTWA